MEGKKIYLVITPFFPSPERYNGGYVYDQVVALKECAQDFRIMVMKPKALWSKEGEYEMDGVKVLRPFRLETPSAILSGIFNGLNAWLLRKYLRKKGIDIADIAYVHAHTAGFACYAADLKKHHASTKVFLQHHDLDPLGINVGRLSDKKWNILYRAKKSLRLYEQIDCHICISEACRENLLGFPDIRKEEKYQPFINKLMKAKGLPHARIKDTYILYNGVNPNIFYQQNLNTKVFTIGCVGNMQVLKNQITLIKAVEYARENWKDEILLKLIGNGPCKAECLQYVEEHHLDYVIFEKERKHDELCGFYNQIDLFCLPSYFEGFGCVFLEAWACGKPFMTCRHQGVENIVEEGDKEHFLLADPWDYKRLAYMIHEYKKNRFPLHIKTEYKIGKLVESFFEYIQQC